LNSFDKSEKRKKITKSQRAKQEQVPHNSALENTYQSYIFLFQKPKNHCSAVKRMLK